MGGYFTFGLSRDFRLAKYWHVGAHYRREETENHVLNLYGWNYLASMWILIRGGITGADSRLQAWRDQGLDWLTDQSDPDQDNEDAFLDPLLQALGRPLHSGFFETNARPYQSISLRAILTLALYGDVNEVISRLGDNFTDIPDSLRYRSTVVRQAAFNAFGYAAAKFAFQSMRAKRSAPIRRRTEYRDEANFYTANRTAMLFGLLSGAHDYDDCTGDQAECRLLRYTHIEGQSALLWAALGRLKARLDAWEGYELPTPVWGQFFDHRPYLGIFQDRYWKEQYPPKTQQRDAIPYFEPGEPTQVMTGSDEHFRGVPELYFGTSDLMLAAGGMKQFADSRRNDVEFEAFHVEDYTFWSRPTMLFPRGDFGHPRYPGIPTPEWMVWDSFKDAWQSQALVMRGMVKEPYNSRCNVWVYNNFVYSYDYQLNAGRKFHKKWPHRFPDWWANHRAPGALEAWVNDAYKARKQRVRFKLFYFAPGDLGPNVDGYYLVLGKVYKDGSGKPGNPDLYHYRRGILEIVPGSRYVGLESLAEDLLAWNDPSFNYFPGDHGAWYRYVTLTGHERLTLDPRMGWGGPGRWEDCRSGIRRVESLADPNTSPADSSEEGRWVQDVNPDNAAEQYIPRVLLNNKKRAKIPLVRVWELDHRYRRTGRMLMESSEPGLVVVRRRAMVWGGTLPAPSLVPGWECLILDSRSYLYPHATQRAVEDYRDCGAPDFHPRQARSVASGQDFACATTTVGRVYCWGSNSRGQLGQGAAQIGYLPYARPVVLPAAVRGKAVSVVAGGQHACLTDDDSYVWCWGANESGQLGDGTYQDRSEPVQVMGSDGGPLRASMVIAGGWHTCAIGFRGEVTCWGSNEWGQLGQPETTAKSAVPLEVTGVLGAVNGVHLAGGLGHTCTTTDTGGLYCWGWNEFGQLGDGTRTNEFEPVAVDFPDSEHVWVLDSVAAGGMHTCAVAEVEFGIRRTYCWGANLHGQLGAEDPAGNDWSAVPLRLTAMGPLANSSHDLRVLTAGWQHTCAVDKSQALWCWGGNGYGQRGDGSEDPAEPVAHRVAGDLDVRLASAGAMHTCAVDLDRRVWCWGWNAAGQLGADELPSSLPQSPDPLEVVWR